MNDDDINDDMNDDLNDGLNDGLNDDISGIVDEDENRRARLTENDYATVMINDSNELFSYFDSAFLRNWSGPEHWKLQRANKSI